MIVIKKTGRRIEVKGHAGFDKKGKDIICAAVSALFTGMVLSVERLTIDRVKYSFTEGDAFLYFRKEPSAESELLTSSFLIAVNAIADDYPDHVRVLAA